MISVTKSYPEPPALTIERAKGAGGSYRIEPILTIVRNDFRNKCYICEAINPTNINIEHFTPHMGNHALKFAWDNLFYSCFHCNNTKGSHPKYNNILNCILPASEPDKKIKYDIKVLPKEKPVFSAIDNSINVAFTIELLEEVYYGTTDLKILESANLRKLLLKEIRNLQELLFEYDDAEFNPVRRAEARQKIANELHPSSSFTAFKRWVVKELLAQEFAVELI